MTAATIPAAALLDALSTDGGFTFDPRSGRLVRAGDRRGWAIARPGTERIIGVTLDPAAFASELATLVEAYGDDLAEGALIGGWHSAERDVYMVEVSDVFDVDQGAALLLGVLRGQESIYDIRTGATLAVPATLADIPSWV